MTENASLTNGVFSLKIHEVRVKDKPLGRHIYHDPRSKDWPFSAISPEGEQTTYVIRDANWTPQDLPFNQGDVGKCTCEACCGALNTTPNSSHLATTAHPALYNDSDTDHLYTVETTNEGMPWPQFDPGGSGLQVCKAAVQLGWFKWYRHTFSLNHALHALQWRPVITGFNWYDSFDQPNASGLIEISPNAFVRGGHETLVFQNDVANRLVRCYNSWGPSWSINGTYVMTWDTWDRLLGEQGDVTVPNTVS
jgi:hypothetical protein